MSNEPAQATPASIPPPTAVVTTSAVESKAIAAKDIAGLRAEQSRQGHRNILGKFIASLQHALEAMEQPGKASYYAVIIANDAAPTVREFSTLKDLTQCIMDTRQLARENPDTEVYMQIFRGNWLHIQKGRRWKLVDGEKLIEIEGKVIAGVDPQGSMQDVDGFMWQPIPEEDITREQPLDAERAQAQAQSQAQTVSQAQSNNVETVGGVPDSVTESPPGTSLPVGQLDDEPLESS